MTRLEWNGDDRPSDRDRTAGLRALKPGRYSVTGYRISRTNDKGEDWFISGILPRHGRAIQVTPGKIIRLAFTPDITIACRGHAAPDGRFAVRAMIAGKDRSGLSIYRNGKRISMAYKISAADGEKLEAGKMNYG